MLQQVLPSLACQNLSDVCPRDGKHFAEFRDGKLFAERPDFQDLLFFEFCCVDSFASVVATPRDCILNIVVYGSKQKVLWIHTLPSVARVSYDKPFWYFSPVRLIGKNVRSAVSSLKPDFPVAVSVKNSGPVPALIFGRRLWNEPIEDFFGCHVALSEVLDRTSGVSVEFLSSSVCSAKPLGYGGSFTPLNGARWWIFVWHTLLYLDDTLGLNPGLKPKRFLEDAIQAAINESSDTLKERTIAALRGEKQNDDS